MCRPNHSIYSINDLLINYIIIYSRQAILQSRSFSYFPLSPETRWILLFEVKHDDIDPTVMAMPGPQCLHHLTSLSGKQCNCILFHKYLSPHSTSADRKGTKKSKLRICITLNMGSTYRERNVMLKLTDTIAWSAGVLSGIVYLGVVLNPFSAGSTLDVNPPPPLPLKE